MAEPANDIDATGGCCCAGCIGEGPCDLGEECAYGCGARVVSEGDVCDRCEDEATGRGDDADEAIEMEYANGRDYDW